MATGSPGGTHREGTGPRALTPAVCREPARLELDPRELLEADAGENVNLGAADLSLSADSRYLSSLNAFAGTINAFRVKKKGYLRV
jgi:hypothetical protein